MTIIEGHAAITPDAAIPVLDIDPYDEDVLRDPYAYYAALRAAGPVAFIPRYAVLAVGRYDEVKEVFSSHDRFVSSRGVGLNDFRLEKPWRPPSIILETDPPEHTRNRTVMGRALAPRVAAELREGFREAALHLVEELLEKEVIDGVEDVAERFPTTVFPKAIGLREVNRRHLVDYGAVAANAFGPDNALRRESLARAPQIVPWVTEACRRERLLPGGIGMAIYAAVDAGELPEADAALLVRSLLSAGVDTTVTGLGNALWCLSQHPEAFARLRADPELARPCIDEVLRFTSPIHTFSRTANLDTEISGLPIPEGSKVLCVLASGNRDPEKWGDADVFRIDRRPAGHLGFGHGIHGCVGQHVARAEIEAILLALASRVARMEPAGPAVWRPNNSMHALDALPVRLIPA